MVISAPPCSGIFSNFTHQAALSDVRSLCQMSFVYLDASAQLTPPKITRRHYDPVSRSATELEEETWPAKTDMATNSGG